MDHPSDLSLSSRAFPSLFHGRGTGHTKMSDYSRTLGSIYCFFRVSQQVRSGKAGPESCFYIPPTSIGTQSYYFGTVFVLHFFQARESQRLPLALSRHQESDELILIRTWPYFSLWDEASGGPEPIALCPHLVVALYGPSSSSTGL